VIKTIYRLLQTNENDLEETSCMWRQEKDENGNVTGIFELDEQTGQEVETGYKHICDNEHGTSVSLWIAGMCMLPYLLIFELIRDWWRSISDRK